MIKTNYLSLFRIRLEARHRPTGKTRHYEGAWTSEGLVHGAELRAPHELRIVQIPPDPGFYLLRFDEAGEEITDTYHDTLAKHSSRRSGNTRWGSLTGKRLRLCEDSHLWWKSG